MPDASEVRKKRPLERLAEAFERYFPVETVPSHEIDRASIDRWAALVKPLSAWFRTGFEGLQNLPAGGALLVTNHGPLGFDSIELVFGIWRRTQRLARGLADRSFFRFGPTKRLLETLGHSAGTLENALSMLKAGDLVLVYPGGAREAFKGSAHRYRLRWEKAKGFVRLALRAGVPIVPVAGIGVDDYYRVVREPEEVAATMFGRALSGLFGHQKYVPPLVAGLGPLPMPAKLTFVIGEPMRWEAAPGAADDDVVVTRIRDEVRERLDRMILTGRIRHGA